MYIYSMRVVPPPVDQPQGNNQNPTNISLQAIKTEEKVLNSGEISATSAPLVTSQNPPIDNKVLIRKKREYKAFMKLIKQGKYTSAKITSKILGVDKTTILEWLHTPMVVEAMNTEIDSYVSRINVSKDWKAQAYLLDKVIDSDKQGTEHTTTLNNLIQINI